MNQLLFPYAAADSLGDWARKEADAIGNIASDATAKIAGLSRVLDLSEVWSRVFVLSMTCWRTSTYPTITSLTLPVPISAAD